MTVAGGLTTEVQGIKESKNMAEINETYETNQINEINF